MKERSDAPINSVPSLDGYAALYPSYRRPYNALYSRRVCIVRLSLTPSDTRFRVTAPLFQVSHGLSSTGLNGKPVRHLDDNPGAAPATVSESKVNQHATAHSAGR